MSKLYNKQQSAEIPTNRLQHIFEKFIVSPVLIMETGTGLGLALVQKLVDLLRRERSRLPSNSEDGLDLPFSYFATIVKSTP